MKKSIPIRIAFCAAILGLAGVSTGAIAALKIQSWTLDNGARVAFVENHSIPMLDVIIQFDAGARHDPAGKAGLAGLTSAMLARGVVAGSDAAAEPALSEAQILDAYADIAAQRGDHAEMDRAGVDVRTLSNPAERDRAVQLTARLLAQPSFPDDLLERDRARVIADIREADTKPEAIADKTFRAALYGSHPYAQEVTEASIASIGRDDLAAFHRAHYVANGAVIAMVGDVTRTQAERIARELTARLPQGAELPAMPDVVIAPGAEQRIAHPASQSHILIGMPALRIGDPDHFALTVGNYVLGGGGLGSRLTREVREKRGLAYSVYSGFHPMAQQGPFQIGLQTKREQTAQALQVVRDTLAAFLRDGPTAAEVKAAKDHLIGGFSLRIDSNLLADLAFIAYYKLPPDYLDTWTQHIADVSVADIRAAFRRKISQAQLHTVIVGNVDGNGSR